MRSDSRAALGILWVLLIPVLCSCVQQMGERGHLRPLEGAPFLARLSGKPPDGTVAAFEPARLEQVPTPLTKRFLEKGQEQFNIYCMPCHGPSGYGDGMIVQRGFLAPPSYHRDRLRQAPDGYFFDVITHGFGAMYSYADRVSVSDRWAIVAYIRALQLSQNARWAELPPEDQREARTKGHE